MAVFIADYAVTIARGQLAPALFGFGQCLFQPADFFNGVCKPIRIGLFELRGNLRIIFDWLLRPFADPPLAAAIANSTLPPKQRLTDSLASGALPQKPDFDALNPGLGERPFHPKMAGACPVFEFFRLYIPHLPKFI